MSKNRENKVITAPGMVTAITTDKPIGDVERHCQKVFSLGHGLRLHFEVRNHGHGRKTITVTAVDHAAQAA